MKTGTSTTARLAREAEKLVKRASALGLVNKKGAALSTSEAFELLAAVAGFRNHHIHLAKLKDTSAEDLAAANAQGRTVWHSLVNIQGWNESSQIIHLEGFLEEKQLFGEFAKYASQVADEENCPDFDSCLPGEPRNAFVAHYAEIQSLLEEAGFTVIASDYPGQCYWERDGEGSEDFKSEKAAWFDAYCSVARETGLDAMQFLAMPVETQLALFKRLLKRDSSPMEEAIQHLQNTWGVEHPEYPREDWTYDVSNGDTKLGYWEWVQHNVESHGGEEAHCTKCGSCSDDEEAIPGGVCVGCQEGRELIEVNLQTEHTFRASIMALSEPQLFALATQLNVRTTGIETKHAMCFVLVEWYTQMCRKAVDDAFEAYDFTKEGDGFTVESCGGWVQDGERWFRAVFVLPLEDQAGDTIKRHFTCIVRNHEVIEQTLS